MYTPKFYGRYDGRAVRLERQKEYIAYLVGTLREGDRVEITVKKHRKKRTTGKPDETGNQNGWYFGVILPLSAKELGYTANELHEIFIQEYAPFTVKTFQGKKIPVKIRTSEMNTLQFSEYCETIRQVMAEQGINIPDPN